MCSRRRQTRPHDCSRTAGLLKRAPPHGRGVVEGIALVPGHAAEPQDLHPRAAVVPLLDRRERAAKAAAAVVARRPGGAPREAVHHQASAGHGGGPARAGAAAHVAARRAARGGGEEAPHRRLAATPVRQRRSAGRVEHDGRRVLVLAEHGVDSRGGGGGVVGVRSLPGAEGRYGLRRGAGRRRRR